MKKVVVRRNGWNRESAICGPFWYIYRGMIGKAVLLLFLCVASLGIGIIPVWIYCGFKGNEDFYNFLKKKHVEIWY